MKLRHATPRSDPFWSLVQTSRRLNAPGGCPWDRAQTVSSLVPHLIEEVWEVFCASRSRNRSHLQEELGDVLYTVIFLTALAEQQQWFTLNALLRNTRRKMERRHPHVFHTKRAATPDDAYRYWQEAKRRERGRKSSAPKIRPVLVELWERLRHTKRTPLTLAEAVAILEQSERTKAKRPTRPNAKARQG